MLSVNSCHSLVTDMSRRGFIFPKIGIYEIYVLYIKRKVCNLKLVHLFQLACLRGRLTHRRRKGGKRERGRERARIVTAMFAHLQ